MEYTRLGKTGLTVSRLGFGAMHLPQLTQEEADRLMNYALDQGITYIDTAYMYKDSQEKLGKAISHRRSEFVLNTKTMKRSYSEALNEIEENLRLLKTDVLDILQIHYVNYVHEYKEVRGLEGAIRAAEEMKKKGYIKHIGITGHRPELLARWLREYPFETVLFHLSMVQPFAEWELMPTAQELDVGMIAMKPLSGPFLKHVREAIRFSSGSKAHVILSGMKSIEEVNMNLAAIEEEVTASERTELFTMAAGMDEHNCRRCNYCSCPLGIRIPDTLIPSRYREKYGLLDAGEAIWQKQADLFASCLEYEPCREQPLCEKVCPYHIPIQGEVRKFSAMEKKAETGRFR